MDKAERLARLKNLSPEKRDLLLKALSEDCSPQRQSQMVPRRTHQSPCRLSFAQERLWFHNQLEPGSTIFNLPFGVRLTGCLNTLALEQSFNAAVQRHEILRTTFTLVASRPMQVIAPSLILPMPVIDLQEVDAAERDRISRKMIDDEATKSFDLSCGPLIRVLVLRLGESEHLLILTVHHIIVDLWSFEVLVKEIATLYEAFLAGKPSPLSEPQLQYADYAEWQREHFEGEVLESHIAYWRKQLAGVPDALELPTDRPRSSVQGSRGARESIDLSKSLTDALRKLSLREGVSLFMTLLAAFQALLYRYTGEGDIVVGTRIAERDWMHAGGLVGLLVNLLPLRTDLSDNPSFRELLKRVRQVTLGAFAHQHLSFEQQVAALQPKRDVSRPALIQVMFVVQNVLMPALHLPDLTLQPFPVESGTAKYDLDFWLLENDAGGLAGSIEYPTSLFDASTIQRLLQHFRRILENVTTNIDVRLSDLTLMPEAEERQLARWNNTQAEYPQDSCLSELFEEQAARTPEAMAVIDSNEQLTYRQLNARANKLAHWIRNQGVGPEVMVSVFLERSVQTLVSIIAILKAGGVYVPLDSSYPSAHLAFVLSDTKSPVVITEQRLLPKLPPFKGTTICLDSQQHLLTQYSEVNPNKTTVPDNAAYVMYTSGTTGRPKGVIVAQRQLLNRCAWMWRSYPFGVGEVACQRTTANFSVSIWEFLGALLQGLPTVILGEDVVKHIPQLIRELAHFKVTRIVVVPSLLRSILESPADLEGELDRLKLWTTCGEALPLELFRKFTQRLPHATLINQYGASEVNDAAFYDTRREPPERPRVPLGRPIDNVKIHILDERLRLVPVGIPGMLHVESVSLARGYLNASDLTAERFIPHPFSDDHGGRLFITGDLARRLPDGTIEYLGRRDHQVKLRGIRIELSGIEEVLQRHPAVAQAAVVVREEDGRGDPRMVAYVVVSKGQTPSVSDLHSYLGERLPLNMLPSSFVLLDALPLTPNGKLDRKALPESDSSRPGLSHKFVPPRTPPERAVAAIWAEVIGLKQVGIHDNFFELGGHSLMATQIISRLRDTLQVDLSLRHFFEEPTVAATAESIFQAQFEQAGDEKQFLLTLAEQLSDDEVEMELRKRACEDASWVLDGSP
jgi:amino acid adenylation domain-containing protein